MKKRRLLWLLLPLLAVFLFSGWMVFRELWAQKRESDDFAALAAEVSTGSPETPDATLSSAEPSGEQTAQLLHKRNLAGLSARNPDFYAWIYIDGTAVNYPVVYTPDEPMKYLRKAFDGGYSHSGVPFLDERCTVDGNSLIIYGHNMKNGTMFSELCDYADPDYRSAHPVIELENLAGCKSYEIFAVALVPSNDDWYGSANADDSELPGLLQHLEACTLYPIDAASPEGKQLLTLSTCYYGSETDDRLIVVAAEIK